jgi:hypothetical protein
LKNSFLLDSSFRFRADENRRYYGQRFRLGKHSPPVLSARQIRNLDCTEWMASTCVIAVAAAAYFVCGFSWQGYIGGPAHSFTVAGKGWNWIAAEPFFLRGLELDGSPASLAVWLQILSVGLAALIPLGSGADRWRLGASCVSTALGGCGGRAAGYGPI